MKIHLKMLLPVLPEAAGSKELDVDFAGETVNDLLDHLISQYGRKARQALLDERGQLDPVIQVLLNGEEWVDHEHLDRALRDGDQVILMLMLAGG